MRRAAQVAQVAQPAVVQAPASAPASNVTPAAVAQFVSTNVNQSGAKAAELTQTLKSANGPPSAQVVQDLQAYIGSLIAGNTSSFSTTVQLGSVSLGGLLQLNTVTLTVNATLSGGNWSGTVTIAATSGESLFPSGTQVFRPTITPSTPGGNALTGTYTIGGAAGQSGSLQPQRGQPGLEPGQRRHRQRQQRDADLRSERRRQSDLGDGDGRIGGAPMPPS